MRTDTHQHFLSRSLFRYDWTKGIPALQGDFLPETRQPLLEQACIDKVIAVQAVEAVAETEWLLQQADVFPWLAGVVGWADFTDAGVAEVLGRLGKHPKLKGWRMVLQDQKPDFLLQPALAQGINLLAGTPKVFELLIKPPQLAAACKLVQACPDVNFVLDHLAKPQLWEGEVAALAEWDSGFRALVAESNVLAVKVSGLMTEAMNALEPMSEVDLLSPDMYEPYIGVALNAAAARRLLIGTDFPVCGMAGNNAMARWIEIVETCMQRLTVEGQEWDLIRRLNAERIYNLGA